MRAPHGRPLAGCTRRTRSHRRAAHVPSHPSCPVGLRLGGFQKHPLMVINLNGTARPPFRVREGGRPAPSLLTPARQPRAHRGTRMHSPWRTSRHLPTRTVPRPSHCHCRAGTLASRTHNPGGCCLVALFRLPSRSASGTPDRGGPFPGEARRGLPIMLGLRSLTKGLT